MSTNSFFTLIYFSIPSLIYFELIYINMLTCYIPTYLHKYILKYVYFHTSLHAYMHTCLHFYMPIECMPHACMQTAYILTCYFTQAYSHPDLYANMPTYIMPIWIHANRSMCLHAHIPTCICLCMDTWWHTYIPTGLYAYLVHTCIHPCKYIIYLFLNQNKSACHSVPTEIHHGLYTLIVLCKEASGASDLTEKMSDWSPTTSQKIGGWGSFSSFFPFSLFFFLSLPFIRTFLYPLILSLVSSPSSLTPLICFEHIYINIFTYNMPTCHMFYLYMTCIDYHTSLHAYMPTCIHAYISTC